VVDTEIGRPILLGNLYGHPWGHLTTWFHGVVYDVLQENVRQTQVFLKYETQQPPRKVVKSQWKNDNLGSQISLSCQFYTQFQDMQKTLV